MSLTVSNNQLEPSTIVLDNDSDSRPDIQEEPQPNKAESTSDSARDAAAVRNGISGEMQRFMLQQKVAIAPTNAKQNNTESEQINIDVLIPKGRTDLTDAEWRQGAARGYYQQKGLQFSQGAIEEAASRLYAVEKGKPDFVRDSSGKIVRDLNNEPIPAYHITFTPRGGTIRADYIASEAKEARELLDSFIPQAQAITAAGTPAVAGTNLEQRLERVKELYQQKYGDLTTQQALDQIFSVKNLTMLGITEVGMKTAAAPLIAGYGAARMTVIDGPKFYLEGVEIKKLIYGAQKPSDLEKAAEKFAGLVKEGKVMIGTSIIGAAGKGIIAGIDRIPAIKFPDITPTGKAVVTEGGPPLNWRMPIEPKPSPALPIGDLIKVVGIESGKGLIGGLATNGNSNISPKENFGGPAGRPDALPMAANNTPNLVSANPGQRVPITDKTLEHIFHGEINRQGRAKGFHYEGTRMEAVKGTRVIESTRSPLDANGVYRANVEIKGLHKREISTFFPKVWSKADVVKAVKEAYVNRVMVDPAKPRYYEGRTSSGIIVGMFLDHNGNIATAFPKYGL